MKTRAQPRNREFTESQIVEILREARLTSAAEVALKHHITEATIHSWFGKFGRLGAEEVKRLRHLKIAQIRRRTRL
jgi:putative transposase